MVQPPLSQKGNQVTPLQSATKKFEVFPASSHKIRKSILAPIKKMFVEAEQYYQCRLPETCQVRGPKVRNCRNYNRIHFFCSRFVFSFFIQEVLKSHTKEITPSHLKCQFPPKIPILPNSTLYKLSEKWLNPPSPRGRGVASYVRHIYSCMPFGEYVSRLSSLHFHPLCSLPHMNRA